jgi:serine/threonine protein kinase
MEHRLQPEAVLRAAARRGWIALADAVRLSTSMPAGSHDSLALSLRQAGAASVADHLPDLLPPDGHPGFGRWRPLARLGGGSMGAVWLAAQDEGPLVVVKTALITGRAPLLDHEAAGSVWTGGAVEPERHSPEAELALRFAREARITAGMDHPRIVPCLDGGVAEDGTRYLVLAWVQTGDLSAMLKRDGPLRPVCALAIADQIADALDHAHGRGVVHRDLKAANVFVHEDGSVLLGDFGLARPTSAGATRLTMAGVAVGTPTAMAPEQIEGRGAIDGRTDLYALGCLLCECMTGKPAFSGRSAEVMHAHRTTAPPDLDALVPGLPPGTAALAARLMAKSPEDRPADARQVRALLAPILRACGGESGRPEHLRIAVANPSETAGESVPNAILLLGEHEEPAIVLWAGNRIVLGKQRGPGTDLVVRDYPEEEHRNRIAKISRHHAVITIDAAGAASIEDLGSANGTFVAGERLPARSTRPLPSGSEIGLAGVTSLRVRTTPDRAMVLERGGNRSSLTYALVSGRFSLGASGSDLPVPGASRRAELAWTPDGWLVDGIPSSCIDLGFKKLEIRPLADWL